LILSVLATTLGALVFSAAPALAAAPEKPELTVEDTTAVVGTPSVEVRLHTIINPKVVVFPVEEGKYHFVYKPGAGPSCVGGTETAPGAYAGLAPEEFFETIAGLTANTQYAVCEVVETPGGTAETATTFKTALPPETPNTLKAELVAGTTATLKGELNPKASAKDGYYFTYGSGGTCEGFTSTPGTEATGTKTKVSTPVSELEGSTEYTFCVVETNEAGESATGTPLKFKTPTAKPVIPSETTPTVSPLSATLEAKVNPENQATKYKLEYAGSKKNLEEGKEVTVLTEGTFPGVAEEQTVGPAETGPVLTPSTTYYYRVVASNGTGNVNGKVEEFTTAALEAPTIYSEGVTAVTQTSAELQATINPNYQKTSFQFKLGESSAYGLGPLPAAPANLRGAIDFSGELPAAVNLHAPEELKLKPNTEYHYEVLATNVAGTVEGLTSAPGDQTFLTLPAPPIVSTGTASAITPISATVTASVNPGASAVGIANPQAIAQDDTTYYAEYGTSTGYGQRTATVDAGEGTSAQPETVNLEGLAPGTTYHYRVVASNLNDAQELNETAPGEYGGTLNPQVVHGEDETFTIPATPPILTGVSVQAITQASATIAATLNPQSLPSRYELQLGATPGELQPVASGGAFKTTELSLPVSSLSPATTYYYRLSATNASSPTNPETNQPVPVEATGSFTTAAAPAATSPGPPALIPYQSIEELGAKEAKEDKGLPKLTTPLTNAEKLKKALKACHAKKGNRRTGCERTARKRFGPIKRKK
jgi:hypothetical protein